MKSILLLLCLSLIMPCPNVQAQPYHFDAEVEKFTGPSTEKAETGIFSDAVYVMTDTESEDEIKVMIKNNGSLHITGVKAHFSVFIENTEGEFEESVFENDVYFDLVSGDSIEVGIEIGPDENQFMPRPYEILIGLGEEYSPAEFFSTMTGNVTPRYKVAVELENDENIANNKIEETFRFFIKKSELNLLVSVENSFQDISASSIRDEIAGRLNADSLIAAVNGAGFTNHNNDEYDILDRKGWYEKSIDYTLYQTIFWADGDDKPLDRTEKDNIEEFLSGGDMNSKKQIVVCSQELSREMLKENEHKDVSYLQDHFAANICPYDNPLGENESNDGNSIIGETVGRYLIFNIKSTEFEGDAEPYCGLVNLYPSGVGMARNAFIYDKHPTDELIDAAGIAKTTLTQNILYTAVDWRHFEDSELLLRAALDYFNLNNGMTLNSYLCSFAIQGDSKKYVYPGDSLKLKFNWSSDIEEMQADIKVQDFINNVTKTVKSAASGYAEYNTAISIDAEPDYNEIYFTYPSVVTTYSGIVVQKYGTSKARIFIIPDTMVVEGSNEICMNDTASYEVTGADRQYLWEAENGEIIGDNDQKTVSVKWTASGPAKLNLTQTYLPTNLIKYAEYDVNVLPPPEKPVISSSGDTLFSSYSFGNRWFLNGVELYGVEDSWFIPWANGSYSLKHTDNRGCESDFSDAYNKVGVEESAEAFLKVYPNPFRESLTFELSIDNPCRAQLKITDIFGADIEILTDEYLEPGIYSIPFNPRGLSSGVYLYYLKIGDKKFVDKIIYNK